MRTQWEENGKRLRGRSFEGRGMKTTNILDGCLIHCGFILNHDQRLTLLRIRESTSQSNITPTCTTLNSKYMGTNCGCFP